MPVEVILPKVDMDMATGTIAEWHKAEGDLVALGEPLFDIETDKSTMEVESPGAGTLQFVAAKVGDEVPIGQTIAWLFAEGEAVEAPGNTVVEITQPEPKPNIEVPSHSPAESRDGEGLRATPLARRVAKERAVPLSDVSGTGPRGRITRADVDAHKPMSSATQHRKADTPEPNTVAAPVYVQTDLKIDALLSLQTQINAAEIASGRAEIRLTDLLIKACARALTALPRVNAIWDGARVRECDGVNVSLLVPWADENAIAVVADAHIKGLRKVSTEVANPTQPEKTDAPALPDPTDRSLMIWDLSAFEAKTINAAITPPHSMALAFGQAQPQFLPDEAGQPKLATILTVTLSCDPRVVDAALGAQWLQKVKSMVENPFEILVT
ncbi:MAG: 2-oxo acid dehydrogenase subunit E2 [Pseudomonadota bacterium]